jgi:peroxiredoxin
LRDVLPEIRARGAELVVIGSGASTFARAFREEHRLDFPLLVDPELGAYAAAGLRRDLRSTFNLKVLGNSVRALRAGHRQGRTRGDPWQQGGVFVITPEGSVSFRHISQVAGDHPDPRHVIAAL